MKMTDMRPISCCTTGEVIGTLVDSCQSAFVPGRGIHDNILLTQELIRGYKRKRYSSRCMLQLDLQKAYDTVEWGALKVILRELGFPRVFVEWVMICVTTVSYKFLLNGNISASLKAERGVHQGDPMSPYLFVLVVEYLHRVLGQLKDMPDYNYHPKCEKLRIINLSFADDLLLFSRGDYISIQMVLGKLETVLASTGLSVNKAKCRIFTCGIESDEEEKILEVAGFEKGSLPFKYLEVPLDSRRFTVDRCSPLIEKITSKINIGHKDYCHRKVTTDTECN